MELCESGGEKSGGEELRFILDLTGLFNFLVRYGVSVSETEKEIKGYTLVFELGMDNLMEQLKNENNKNQC